jgi:hypothetical protein
MSGVAAEGGRIFTLCSAVSLTWRGAADELLTRCMRRKNSAPPKAPMAIRTHALSEDTDQILNQLSQEASDLLGWRASNSAIVRALLRYASQRPPDWKAKMLFPLIEREIVAGVHWGGKKQ